MQNEYLQIGTGRLGSLIAKHVKASTNLHINYARIDPQTGLINSNAKTINGEIDQLVLCLSPSQSSPWKWGQILNGVVKQVALNELKIHKLIFISSTRVYDGINEGVITAETPVNAHSQRAKELFKAEQQIAKLTNNFHILRCCGLYGKTGQAYQKYLEILTRKDNKTRFGVDIEEVADSVVEKLKEGDRIKNSQVSTYSLLTDGYCHFNGEKIAAEDACHLSDQHRLLINSQVQF